MGMCMVGGEGHCFPGSKKSEIKTSFVITNGNDVRSTTAKDKNPQKAVVATSINPTSNERGC